MSKIVSIVQIITALAFAAACGDMTPDGDVQFRCEGEHAAELCAHASNAAAELRPHVNYEIVVSDPDVLGVTWRSADRWTISVRPAGYVVPATLTRTAAPPLCGGGPLAVTVYDRRAIYVGACAIAEDGWDLGTIVRHEIGHSLGVVGHDGAGLVMAADLEQGSGPQEYDAEDIETIASVRRGESNDIIEALWID